MVLLFFFFAMAVAQQEKPLCSRQAMTLYEIVQHNVYHHVVTPLVDSISTAVDYYTLPASLQGNHGSRDCSHIHGTYDALVVLARGYINRTIPWTRPELARQLRSPRVLASHMRCALRYTWRIALVIGVLFVTLAAIAVVACILS